LFPDSIYGWYYASNVLLFQCICFFNKFNGTVKKISVVITVAVDN